MEQERKTNVLDDVIAWFSPQTAAKREAWRQFYNEQRGYDAAGKGRLNKNWIASNGPAEHENRMARDIVRARARDLERNSDMAGGVISAFKRNVIGYGFVLQARTGDDELNEKIESEWREWTKKWNCDVTGQQSFTQMLRMAVQRKKIDGGIMFLKCYSGTSKIPLQLQALEVDELSGVQTTPKNRENKVVGGIELNRYNRPVGYWIEQYRIDDWSIIEPVFYPADRIIFLWQKTRPSQIREISEFAPTLTRIRDANELMTAASVKERIAACLSVFIKRSLPLTAGVGGRGMSAQEAKKEYDGKMLTPGMISELNAGDEIQVVDPKANATQAKEMLALHQRLIASGHGLSYEATSRDMSGVNYSSARQGTIEDDLTIAEDVELIEEFMTEVYESFIICGCMAGVFDMPGFFTDYEKKKKYLDHKWVSSPKPWIDPIKEANANKTALETAQKTFADICAENGRDWRDVINEIAEIKEYCAQKGVTIGGEIYAIQQPNEQKPDESGTE